jgi:hypothetical protein
MKSLYSKQNKLAEYRNMIVKTVPKRPLAVFSVFTFFFLCFFVISALFSSHFAEAAINKQMNYQGKLTDVSGDPVANGTYNMEFILYSVSSGGSPLWTETRTGGDKVQVTNGLFSVMLGEVTSLASVDFNQTLYLGVNIGDTGSPDWDGEMTPRKKLGSVPSAVVAETVNGFYAHQFFRNDNINSTSSAISFLKVEQAGAGAIAQFIGTGSSTALIVKSDGTVGIGTTTGAHTLTVAGTLSAEGMYGSFLRTSGDFAVGLELIGGGEKGGLYDLSTDSMIAVMNDGGQFFYGVNDVSAPSGGIVVDGAGGNVGIGTSSPLQKLSVQGNMRLTGAFFDTVNASGTLGMMLQSTGTGTRWIATSSLGISGGSGNSAFTIGNGLIYNATSTDFVGIGTTTPVNALTVLSATAPQFRAAYDASNYLTTGIDSNGVATLSSNGTTSAMRIFFSQPASIVSTTATNATTSLFILGATGGDTTAAVTGTGGIGGGLVITSGTGGRAVTSSVLSQAGNGGVLNLTSGAGGFSTSTGTNIGGFGGTLNLTGGAGGLASGGSANVGGFGGSVVISGGAGGAGSTQAGTGGWVYIVAGAAGTGGSPSSAPAVYLGNYNSSTSTVIFGPNQAIFDPTYGRFGIGTTTPMAMLSVKGTTTTPYIFAAASSSNATVLVVANTGNVGIGTSSPLQSLSVQGNMRLTGAFFDTVNASGTLGMMLQSTGTGTRWVATSTLGLGGVGGSGTVSSGLLGQVAFYAADGTTVNGTSSIFFADGYVGIGTTIPTQQLTVGGNIALSSGANRTIGVSQSTNSTNGFNLALFAGDAGNTVEDPYNGGAVYIYGGSKTFDGTDGNVILGHTGSVARGNVGVGTTSPTSSFFIQGKGGTNPFAIASSTGASMLTLLQNGNVGVGTTTPVSKLSVVGTAGSVSNIFTVASSSNASYLVVTQAGNVGIGTTTPVNALTVLSATGPQFRVAYDASNYLTTEIDSNGVTTLSSNGTTSGMRIFYSQPAAVSGSTGTTATTSLYILGATGGDVTTAVVPTAGNGGALVIRSGTGGQATAGSVATIGGIGGELSLAAGTGGVATSSAGTSAGGIGGLLNLTGGTGGAATAGANRVGGNGGAVLISGGAGGAGTTLSSPGGTVYIVAGVSGAGATPPSTPGAVYLGFSSTNSATSSVFFGNNQGVFDTRYGRFGIGTTTPMAMLSVRGTSSTPYLFALASSTNATALVVTNDGYVGIGTSSPLQALSVSGNLRLTGAFFDTANASGTSGMVLLSTGTGTQWSAASSLIVASSTNFTIAGTFYVPGVSNGCMQVTSGIATSTGTNCGGGSSAFSVGNGVIYNATSTDLVGIGTSSPVTTLFVQGKGGTNPFAVASSSGLQMLTVTQSGDVGIGTSTPTALLAIQGTPGSTSQLFDIASSSGSTYFHVMSNGNVGIGTSTPAEKLHVAGNILIGARTDSAGAWTLRSNSTAGTMTSGGTPQIGTTSAMAVFNGSLYAGTSKPGGAEIYRYDGSTWTKVSSTTAGAIGLGTTTGIDSISSMAVWNGQLYVGTAEAGLAEVYRYNGNSTWTRISSSTVGAVGGNATTTAIDSISSMTVHGGNLYVGTTKANAAEVYRYNGPGLSPVQSWTKVSHLRSNAGTIGVTANVDSITTLFSFQGFLYAGTSENNASAAIYRYDGQNISGSGFILMGAVGQFSGTDANGSATAITSVGSIRTAAVYNGRVYLGIDDGANTARVVKWDGHPALSATSSYVHISSTTPGIISEDVSPQTGIDRIGAMSIYNDDLFVGTVDSTGIAEVYKLDDGLSWSKVSSTTAGTIHTGGATPTPAITGIFSMAVYNDDLWVGTEKALASEVYSYNMAEGQSYNLAFEATSDDADAIQNGLTNKAYIQFQAEETGYNNTGNMNTGKFVFSHGINTVTGAYDLAEDYPTADDTLAPGDLVSLDTTRKGFVRKSHGKSDRDVIGIYSVDPALRLSQKDAGIDGYRAIPVALAGRVPVSVTLENGPIRIGDYLTSSMEPGKAAKANKPSRVIGRALGAYSGIEGEEASVVVFIGAESISWNDLADAETDVSEIADESSVEGQNAVIEFVDTVQDKIADIAFAILNKTDNLNIVITNKLTALAASVQDFFAKNISILPNGSISLPSGENQIAGIGMLSIGSTDVFIQNEQIDENTTIYLSPTSELDSPLYIGKKEPGKGFHVRTKTASNVEVTFDWFFVKTYRPKGNASQEVTTVIEGSNSTSSATTTVTSVSTDTENVTSAGEGATEADSVSSIPESVDAVEAGTETSEGTAVPAEVAPDPVMDQVTDFVTEPVIEPAGGTEVSVPPPSLPEAPPAESAPVSE